MTNVEPPRLRASPRFPEQLFSPTPLVGALGTGVFLPINLLASGHRESGWSTWWPWLLATAMTLAVWFSLAKSESMVAWRRLAAEEARARSERRADERHIESADKADSHFESLRAQIAALDPTARARIPMTAQEWAATARANEELAALEHAGVPPTDPTRRQATQTLQEQWIAAAIETESWPNPTLEHPHLHRGLSPAVLATLNVGAEDDLLPLANEKKPA